MLKKGKVYIPKGEVLRVEVIQLHHNVPVLGYGRIWKITELVTRNYWWLGVIRDIGKYVEECNVYQRIKNRTEALVGK